MPAKGKAKAAFKKDAAVYALPGGQSPAVLLSLPAYQSPYTLTVSSKRHGMGRTTEIFVPSLVLLDDTFAVIGSYGVEDAPTVASNRTLNPTESIYKDFTIDGQKAKYTPEQIKALGLIDLSPYSVRQLDGMINDQVMFLIEHVHAGLAGAADGEGSDEQHDLDVRSRHARENRGDRGARSRIPRERLPDVLPCAPPIRQRRAAQHGRAPAVRRH